MAPRQAPAGAWYSSALDSSNVSEASLARLRRMATAWGIDGAKVFKAGSALPEGQGSTFYPLFVSAIVAGLVPPFSEFFFSASVTITFKLCISTPTLSSFWQSSPAIARLTWG